MYQYNYEEQRQSADSHHRQPLLFDDTSPGGYQYQQGLSNANYNEGYGYNPNNYGAQQFVPPPYPTTSSSQMPQGSNAQFGFNPGQFMKDPLIANVAMQYGQNLAAQGQEFIDKKIEKYVSVSKIKYYFAVDTQYVLRKLKVIFFPYTHSDWSVQFDQSEGIQVQPRHDVNAPDLYIPSMAFVTYILMAGLSLGLMDRFTPEVLGMQASSAIAWLLLEVCCVLAALHINSGVVIRRPLHALHVLALAGYKYPGMICMLGAGVLLPGTGYYLAQAYCSAALALFMFRTLRSQVQSGPSGTDPYGNGGYGEGNKRRFYLLLFLTLLQPLFMWWLTRSVVYYQFRITVPV